MRFFDMGILNEIIEKETWISEGFRIIDDYMQEYLRYLYSGRHYKGNYKITYEMLKKIGYRNLVNEYYKYIKERRYSIP